jgi:hypothetical protein
LEPRPGNLRILACGAFKPALDRLEVAGRTGATVKYLPSRLHLHPAQLRESLLREIEIARAEGETPLVLYGQCFPEMDEELRARGVRRLPGTHCYEMLLGEEGYRETMKETAGVFFLERDLITDFDAFCARPLELHDAEMRREIFRHTRKVVYVRQPEDADLEGEAERIAAFLERPLEIRDADIRDLERRLAREVSEGCGPGSGPRKGGR